MAKAELKTKPTTDSVAKFLAAIPDPDRVPINNPSSGVNPIEVSIDFPFWIAVIEAPLPR